VSYPKSRLSEINCGMIKLGSEDGIRTLRWIFFVFKLGLLWRV